MGKLQDKKGGGRKIAVVLVAFRTLLNRRFWTFAQKLKVKKLKLKLKNSNIKRFLTKTQISDKYFRNIRKIESIFTGNVKAPKRPLMCRLNRKVMKKACPRFHSNPRWKKFSATISPSRRRPKDDIFFLAVAN